MDEQVEEDMTIAAIEGAIRQVRRQLKTYPPEDFGYMYRELATRYLLIDPVVRALDWDMGDFWQRAVEWPLLKDDEGRIQWSKKADYVLFNPNERPVIVIEAKRVGTNLDGWETQLKQYTTDMRSGMGVLTDGVIWRLYNLRKRGEFPTKQAVTVDIPEGTICENGDTSKVSARELAQTLNEWLDKDWWW